MSTTLLQARSLLSQRLGETSAPSNDGVNGIRNTAINEGVRYTVSQGYWWFTRTSATLNTVADQETYTTTDGMPSDLRDIYRLQVDDLEYTPLAENLAYGKFASGAPFNISTLTVDKHWYMEGTTLHILPTPTANGTNNITLKYYKWADTLSGDSDTLIIPDGFVDLPIIYANAYLRSQLGRRDEAKAIMEDYARLMRELVAENKRHTSWGKGRGMRNSEWLTG